MSSRNDVEVKSLNHVFISSGAFVLGDALAQTQVEQIFSQQLVLQLPKELGLLLPLSIQSQRLPELRLDTTELDTETHSLVTCEGFPTAIKNLI